MHERAGPQPPQHPQQPSTSLPFFLGWAIHNTRSHRADLALVVASPQQTVASKCAGLGQLDRLDRLHQGLDQATVPTSTAVAAT